MIAEVKVSSESTAMTWSPEQRTASIRYAPDATLTRKDGVFLVEVLTTWIGADGQPFAVLADAAGLAGADARYRAEASNFFRQHRDSAFIALINLGPVIHIVVELFRVGTRIQLKTFACEADARGWLRTKGIAA
jgi:hypothetical protein